MRKAKSNNLNPKEGGGNEDKDKVYAFESIRDTRTVKGKTQYLVKWEGCPEEQNTWEPRENLICDDSVIAVEIAHLKTTKGTTRDSKSSGNSRAGQHSQRKKLSVKVQPKVIIHNREYKGVDVKVCGFAKGLDPELVLGMDKTDGELICLIKWKDSNKADFVFLSEARLKCPDLVIAFLQPKVTWSTREETEDQEMNTEESDETSYTIQEFDNGLEPDKIFRSRQIDGELVFWMNWKGSEEAGLVLAKDANIKCPQLVIDFYMTLLSFRSKNSRNQ